MVKKIAIFLPHMGQGGVPRSMSLLARGLSAKGHDVEIISFNNRDQSKNYHHLPSCISRVTLKRENGLLCRYRLIRYFLADLRYLLLPSIICFKPCKAQYYLHSLIEYIDKNQPDVLYSAQPHCNIVAVMASLISQKSATKIILTEVTAISKDIESRSHKFRWKYIIPLMQQYYPRADLVVAVSKCVASDLRSLLAPVNINVKPIYNISSIDDMRDRISEQSTSLHINQDYKLVVAVGRLVEQKNYMFMIEAFSLARNRQKLKLLILGDGYLRKQIQNYAESLNIADDLILMGYENNPYPNMRRSDVYVMTSLWEGMPNVLLEALACGCKVIALDCPCGPREILEDGKFGTLLPVDVSAKEYAEAILHEVNREHDATSQLQQLRQFSVECITEQHLNEIMQL